MQEKQERKRKTRKICVCVCVITVCICVLKIINLENFKNLILIERKEMKEMNQEETVFIDKNC